MIIKPLSLLFLAALATASFGGCEKPGTAGSVLTVSKITRANYDLIHEKASKEEVQAILGAPTSTDTKDTLIYKKTTWRYTEGNKYINLTFKNDELDSKDTNLGT